MRIALLLLLAALAGCGPKPVTLADYQTQVVAMPDGTRIRAEVMTDPRDMARGMMFRDSLAPDRGMLFIHQQPGNYSYWMYQCEIPLDIIWLDENRRVVEISANTPPCKSEPEACPQYGGARKAQFVLELAAGMAAKYGVRVGDTLAF